MKKYLTLFLGYWIVFQVVIYIGLIILWALGSFVLLIVWWIWAAIWATMIDFSNFTLSNMWIISIVFNLILLIWVFAIFYIVLKMVSDWAFNWNIKSWYFTKETINMDLIYSTIFVALIPITIVILEIIEKWNYYNWISALIYIISFYVVGKIKAKKEFSNNK
jgi:hypothetical protein